MNRKIQEVIFYSVIFGLLLGFTLSCNSLQRLEGNEAKLNYHEEFYSIDPTTILINIDLNKPNVFIPEIAAPDPVPPYPGSPYQWSQTDYFKVAQALSDSVWNEPLDHWKLNSLNFGLSCDDINLGPQDASLTFFKLSHTRNQESRIVRIIYIQPRKKSVYWTEEEYSPNLEQWEEIDLSSIKITTTEALQVTEKNGGFELRESTKNSCSIFLIFRPGSEYDGWQVGYSGYGDYRGLAMKLFIDPESGELVQPIKK